MFIGWFFMIYLAGNYYHHPVPNEVSPHVQNIPSQGYYQQLPVSPGMMPQMATHPAVHVMSQPPLSPPGGYLTI